MRGDLLTKINLVHQERDELRHLVSLTPTSDPLPLQLPTGRKPAHHFREGQSLVAVLSLSTILQLANRVCQALHEAADVRQRGAVMKLGQGEERRQELPLPALGPVEAAQERLHRREVVFRSNFKSCHRCQRVAFEESEEPEQLRQGRDGVVVVDGDGKQPPETWPLALPSVEGRKMKTIQVEGCGRLRRLERRGRDRRRRVLRSGRRALKSGQEALRFEEGLTEPI